MTKDGLAAVQGYTANADAAADVEHPGGTVDASAKFAAKDKTKTSISGSVATFTCSGATALAVSGAAVTAFISLM